MHANVLVIVVDGLRASALGAYGNTSFPTPALDRLASESVLFDSCFAASPELSDIYRALWQSQASKESRSANSLPRLFASAGYDTALVTDEPSLCSLPSASEFDEIVQISTSLTSAAASSRAHDSAETQIANALATVADQVESAQTEKPRLVWHHTRGMYGSWDAPLDLQESLRDQDDPPPIESVDVPNVVLSSGDDSPDIIFQHTCGYAAQVMVLDECCGNVFQLVTGNTADWLIVLIGARGFPLGEHKRIGGPDDRTYGEQLHVPWLIRFPDQLGRLARSAALTSHFDLLPTLAAWLDGDAKPSQHEFEGMSVLPLVSSVRAEWREAMISKSASARSIRTASWCLRENVPRFDDVASASESAPPAELYVRPDDRCEANDIAKLCSEVVEELQNAMRDC